MLTDKYVTNKAVLLTVNVQEVKPLLPKGTK